MIMAHQLPYMTVACGTVVVAMTYPYMINSAGTLSKVSHHLCVISRLPGITELRLMMESDGFG